MSTAEVSVHYSSIQSSSQSRVSQPSTPKSNSRSATNSATVALPALKQQDLDTTKPLPTSLQSDFIPEDVLKALTQPTTRGEILGPPSRYRNLATTNVASRKPPANVWSHPKRRERFKHLTENTVCICGAGKDISFLYDVPPNKNKPIEKPGLYDASAQRNEAQKDKQSKPSLQLPDTLIPEEYHIVKNKGVMGLEFNEEKYAIQATDHEKHLVVFPSMVPVSRNEVVQLKKTMEEMLNKLDARVSDVLVEGETQMHQLLELIKMEQDIYNVVFHEIIRQISVDCIDRGELLANLRNKYSDLLNRIPLQVKSLHEEVMAQRALDRRLTEELMRFKNTIGILTNELINVKEHDRKVTKECQMAQEDLSAALEESKRNSSLLSEYHELYELQRMRLENQVNLLTDEKELWSTAAYCLALKVTAERNLQTAQRLHVSEKAWQKLGNHFVIVLSDQDTEVLTRLQTHVDTWRDLIEGFNFGMKQRDEEMKVSLHKVRDSMSALREDFEQTHIDEDGCMHHVPDNDKVTEYFNTIKQWEESIGQAVEQFGGDIMLTQQETLENIRKEVEGWTDCGLIVFNRHRGEDGSPYPDHDNMMHMNSEIDDLLTQYQIRLTGENGVARGIIQLHNIIETWDNKLNTMLHGSNPLPDMEWMRFYQLIEEWVASINETETYIGTTQKEEDREAEKKHRQEQAKLQGIPEDEVLPLETDKPKKRRLIIVDKKQRLMDADSSSASVKPPPGYDRSVEYFDAVKITQRWVSSATNGIDSEDAKLTEQVSSLHTEMVKWMVHMLLHIAPDREENSAEAKEMVLLGASSITELTNNAHTLFERLDNFTRYLAICCENVVRAEMQRKLDLQEENADLEFKDLQRTQNECDEWIDTAMLLLNELTGEVIHFKSRSSTMIKSEADRQNTDLSSVTVPIEKPIESVEPTVAEEEDIQKEEDHEEVVGVSSVYDGPEPETSKTTAEMVSVPIETVETDPTEETDQAAAAEVVEEEKLEKIGHDSNTHFADLQQDPDGAPPPTEHRMSSEDIVPPDTEKAYEALATVQTLQNQLVAAEERAQLAEDKARSMENELISAMEKIRALERQMFGADPLKIDQKSDSKDDAKDDKHDSGQRGDKSRGPSRTGAGSRQASTKHVKKK
ncbi:axonemal dynein light chain domain-containing protein 1-like [Tubulanus polymorphus]|uniref:axonemal dynein light chain domain-containing protein 1-like n=1 Tax=Tubulanus polymorphus TaxID=672921 RepID=UPI003DA3A0AD